MKKLIRFLHTFFLFLNLTSFDSRLRTGRILGRSWSPLRFSARFFSFCFGKQNYNNILLHAKNIQRDQELAIADSGTFNFSRYIEKKLLQKIVNILNLPFAEFSGYLTTGATEANIYSLWVAREWANKLVEARSEKKIYWLIPKNVHYSIIKALRLLAIEGQQNNEVILIDLDQNGRANLQQIIQYVELAHTHENPVVLVMTAMSTEYGSIDPLKEVDQYIASAAIKNFHLHVDAAFSGFFLPFAKGYENIFSIQSLSSISLDFHKTIGGPVGVGAVVMRSGFEKFAKVEASYLKDGADFTLVGSRKGIDALAIYSIFDIYDIDDFKKEVAAMQTKTQFLANSLARLSFIRLYYEPTFNYIVFSLDNLSPDKELIIRKIFAKFSVSSSEVESDGKKISLFKIVIRQDHSVRLLRKFVLELAALR